MKTLEEAEAQISTDMKLPTGFLPGNGIINKHVND